MRAAELIATARRRAGLSQRELADRLATSQPAIVRWESGRTEPSLASVTAAAAACGFDLEARLVEREERRLPAATSRGADVRRWATASDADRAATLVDLLLLADSVPARKHRPLLFPPVAGADA